MPVKSHKTPKDNDDEKEKKAEPGDVLDEEESEDEAEEKPSQKSVDDDDKSGPKINFEYEEPEDGSPNPKREETLEELANKYRDEPDEDAAEEVAEPKHHPVAEPEEEIPQMRAQMPTSGIYSAQDIRRGNGELHQAPYMRSSFSSHNNDNYHPNKSSKLHFVILALIGLVVLGSAVYLLKYQFKATKPSPTPSPSPVAQATPTPSPTPVPIDRSKYTVRVLNGTGKSGLAASVSAKLKDLGYKIDKTGNASNTDQTTISAKRGDDELIKQLITDLTSDYKASSASAFLKPSDSADAEVIIGSK
jgi:hypothetical protein